MHVELHFETSSSCTQYEHFPENCVRAARESQIKYSRKLQSLVALVAKIWLLEILGKLGVLLFVCWFAVCFAGFVSEQSVQ